MRVALILLGIVILIGVGILIAPYFFDNSPSFETYLERMREDVVVLHERNVTTTYHVCPERDGTFSIPGVTNRPPKLFMVVPATLRYRLPLDQKNMQLQVTENEYVVTFTSILADEPFTDSEMVQAIVTDYQAGTAEERYQDREKSRATPLNRYLTIQQLRDDLSTIRNRMERELLVSLNLLLNAVDDSDRKIIIQWNDNAQKEYVANQLESLGSQPPFGIIGCDDVDRPSNLFVNGIDLVLPSI